MYALGETHMRSAPSRRSSPSAAFQTVFFLFSTVGVTAGQWPLFVLLKEDSRCERFLFLLHLSPPGDLCRFGVLGLGAVNTLLVNMVLNVHRNRKAYWGRGEWGEEYGGGGRGRLHSYRYTVTTRMTSALRCAAVRAILMFHHCEGQSAVSYTHLTLPTSVYV